jgi:regulator of nucleoside diphosphate kinase
MDNKIFITEKDYLRLSNLLNNLEVEPDSLENLEIEMERATILSDDEVPSGLVTMNSTVEYEDLSSGKSTTITIIYPGNETSAGKNISVLAPLGSALLGLKEGQEINWKFPSGKTKRLKIIKVMYQPEANGDWHL